MIITILIATRNHAQKLRTTLENLTRQSYEFGQFITVVVDNNSSDETPEVVAGFKGKLPVRYIFEGKAGKNKALNRALSEVDLTDILVFTDDDIDPSPNWLREIAGCSLRNPNCSVFGGRIVPRWPKDAELPSWLCEPKYRSLIAGEHDRGDTEMPYGKDETPFGANFWVRREVFANGRRFNERIGPKPGRRIMGSESSFLIELQREGYEAIYYPSALVYHLVDKEVLSLKNFLVRAFRHGRSEPHISGFRQPSLARDHVLLWLTIRVAGLMKAFAKLSLCLFFGSASKRNHRIGSSLYSLGCNWESVLLSLEKRHSCCKREDAEDDNPLSF